LQPNISHKIINDFLLGEKNAIYSLYSVNKHRILVKYPCFGIIDRAAKIAAIFTALFTLSAKSVSGKVKSVSIVVEGTTFHNLKSFRKRYSIYLKEYLLPHGIKYNFIYHEDIYLIGAARSA
jgi:hexokinase